jgi:predicted O-methyltransferase YrrM
MDDSLNAWIAHLYERPEMLQMGHGQRKEDLNLGLGWLYYGLVRVIRPATIVSIGSYRGFVPMVLAKALADNNEGGQVHFIDPSLVDGFWKVESEVQAHFTSHGLTNIRHHHMTTQQFVKTDTYRQLDNLGIVFVDGYHTAEQARFDLEAFADKLAPQGMALLHDSVWGKKSKLYGEGRVYDHNVMEYVADLKQDPQWQVMDMPFGSGVTMVRRANVGSPPANWRHAGSKERALESV